MLWLLSSLLLPILGFLAPYFSTKSPTLALPTSATFTDVIDSQFASPISNARISLAKAIKDLHPSSQVIAVGVSFGASAFPLNEYLQYINTSVTIHESESLFLHQAGRSDRLHFVVPDNEEEYKAEISREIIAGVVSFRYHSTLVRAYRISVQTNQINVFYALVYDGKDDLLGQQLASDVFTWANSLKEEIWVFEEGKWSKNGDMYDAIQASNWDDVVLNEEFKQGLRRDTGTFFASQKVYNSLGIAWKRGILLLGPPGNGKTESIKALLHEFNQPALYVKSFTTPFVRYFHSPPILFYLLDMKFSDIIRTLGTWAGDKGDLWSCQETCSMYSHSWGSRFHGSWTHPKFLLERTRRLGQYLCSRTSIMVQLVLITSFYMHISLHSAVPKRRYPHNRHHQPPRTDRRRDPQPTFTIRRQVWLWSSRLRTSRNIRFQMDRKDTQHAIWP